MAPILKKLVFIIVFFSFLMVLHSPVTAGDGKININTADQQELSLLKRIGPKYAVRIIKYREENGNFENPRDITKVRGIGLKTFEANKDMIIVEEEEVVETSSKDK